ncbi:MAG: flavodoxin domain-containing protein [Actinomycetota bacterium]|nr:flavodoxin domain-containing protein [Actinomycetota bacterium]
MKVLVTVASRHGSTEAIAEAIGAALKDNGLDADVRRIDSVSTIADYDAAVIGSAVYVGRWLDAAKRFVEDHAEALRARPVWLFSSGPLGDPPKPAEQPVDAPAMMEAVQARGHAVFAGELQKDRLGLGERTVVRMVRAPYGDFRDWRAARDWAAAIARELKARGGGADA